MPKLKVFPVESFGDAELVKPSAELLDIHKPSDTVVSSLDPVMEKNNDNSWFDDSVVTVKKNIQQSYSLFGKENRSKKSMAKITAKKASLVANDDHNSDHEILLDHDRNIYPSPKTDDQDLVSEIDLIHSSHINHLSNADVMKMAFCGDTVVKVDD